VRDYKTRLQEQAQASLSAVPRYKVVGETGPDHAKVFEVAVVIGGKPHGRGTGRSKKEAEQAAARQALAHLAADGAATADAVDAPKEPTS
jgi:ribonuclease-3